MELYELMQNDVDNRLHVTTETAAIITAIEGLRTIQDKHLTVDNMERDAATLNAMEPYFNELFMRLGKQIVENICRDHNGNIYI